MDNKGDKSESDRLEEALESFRKTYKQVRMEMGKNWCLLNAFKKARIEDENNMAKCRYLEDFKAYHLVVGNVYSDKKAPIDTIELRRADEVRSIIKAACLELKPVKAAVVRTCGKSTHH